MTLSQIYKALSDIALEQPNMRTIVLNDIYKLDTLKDVRYSVFGITQNYEHEQDETRRYYSLNLYYIDRLLEDGSNDVDIQSTGIEVLSNIIETLLEELGGKAELDETVKYQCFTQKFVDETSGVYARIKLAIPLSSYCEETY